MKTILIVDDSITIRRMLCNALQDASHIVIEASDGAEAMSILGKVIPDIIVTDVHMADVNGIELTERVRAHPRLRSMPVLILSTELDEQFKDSARAAGATGWLRKPFDDQNIRAAIRGILS